MKKRLLAGIAFGIVMLGMAGIGKASTWKIEIIEISGPHAEIWDGIDNVFWDINYSTDDWGFHAYRDYLFNPGVIDPGCITAGTTTVRPGVYNFLSDAQITFDSKTLEYMGNGFHNPSYFSRYEYEYARSYISENQKTGELKLYMEDDGVIFYASSDTNEYSFLSFTDADHYPNTMQFKVVSVDYIENIPNPVPVPASMLLLGTGLAGLVGSKIRRNKKA